MRLDFAAMIERFHIEHDWATILAILFGAAVILPSVVALVISIGAVARLLL